MPQHNAAPPSHIADPTAGGGNHFHFDPSASAPGSGHEGQVSGAAGHNINNTQIIFQLPPGVAVTGLPAGVTAPTPAATAPTPAQVPTPPTTPPASPATPNNASSRSGEPTTGPIPTVPPRPAGPPVGRVAVPHAQFPQQGARPGLGAAGLRRTAGERLYDAADRGPYFMTPRLTRDAEAYGRALSELSKANVRRNGADRQRLEQNLQQAEAALLRRIDGEATHMGLAPGLRLIMAEQAYIHAGQRQEDLAEQAGWMYSRGARIAVNVLTGGLVAAASWLTGGIGAVTAIPAGYFLGRYNARANRRQQHTPEATRARVRSDLGRISTGMADYLISFDPGNAALIAGDYWADIGRGPGEAILVDDAWQGGAAGPGGPDEPMGLSAGARDMANRNRRNSNRAAAWGVGAGTLTAALGAGAFAFNHGWFPFHHVSHPAAAPTASGAEHGGAAGASMPPNPNALPTVPIDLNQHAWTVAHAVSPGHEYQLMQQAIDLANSHGGQYALVHMPNGTDQILFGGHTMVGNQRDVINTIIYGLGKGI